MTNSSSTAAAGDSTEGPSSEELGGDSSFLRKVAGVSERPPPAVERDRTGERIGKYEIVRELGRGGMGVVYRARDAKLGRDVALKLVRAKAESDPEIKRRFLREARAASAVRHPSVAVVYEVGEHEDETFIAMELVHGESLRAKLANGRLPVAEAKRIAADIASALEAAHRAGIVHRDLKPDNVIVEPNGGLKVLDFGLARRMSLDDAAPGESEALTMDGHILGTPGYMSPEQVSGLAADMRSDVFSLGVILFEMLTGARPFSGKTKMDVLVSTSRDPAPSVLLLRKDAGRGLARALGTMLAKEPSARPASAERAKALILAAEKSSLGVAIVIGAVSVAGIAATIAFVERRPAATSATAESASASASGAASPTESSSVEPANPELSSAPAAPSSSATSAASEALAKPSAQPRRTQPLAPASSRAPKRDPLADQK